MANRLTAKGDARKVRFEKREEAEARNAKSPDNKRRSYWRGLGFRRQSEAARTVKSVVTDINEQAKAHKQRSEDWPLVIEEFPYHEGVTRPGTSS